MVSLKPVAGIVLTKNKFEKKDTVATSQCHQLVSTFRYSLRISITVRKIILLMKNVISMNLSSLSILYISVSR